MREIQQEINLLWAVTICALKRLDAVIREWHIDWRVIPLASQASVVDFHIQDTIVPEVEPVVVDIPRNTIYCLDPLDNDNFIQITARLYFLEYQYFIEKGKTNPN